VRLLKNHKKKCVRLRIIHIYIPLFSDITYDSALFETLSPSNTSSPSPAVQQTSLIRVLGFPKKSRKEVLDFDDKLQPESPNFDKELRVTFVRKTCYVHNYVG
jgi:hypothetical protein